VAIFWGDTLTVEDVWIEGYGYNQSAFKALFENHGKLILNRMLGAPRVRSHCRFVLPLIHFIPDSLRYSVPLFLKR
jgi:hypothetical protein